MTSESLGVRRCQRIHERPPFAQLTGCEFFIGFLEGLGLENVFDWGDGCGLQRWLFVQDIDQNTLFVPLVVCIRVVFVFSFPEKCAIWAIDGASSFFRC